MQEITIFIYVNYIIIFWSMLRIYFWFNWYLPPPPLSLLLASNFWGMSPLPLVTLLSFYLDIILHLYNFLFLFYICCIYHIWFFVFKELSVGWICNSHYKEKKSDVKGFCITLLFQRFAWYPFLVQMLYFLYLSVSFPQVSFSLILSSFLLSC